MEFEYNGITYRRISRTHAQLGIGSPAISHSGTPIGKLEIPQNVSDGNCMFIVAGVADNAFANYLGITEIVLPNTVQYIGREAFRNNVHLQTVNIPYGITRIESGTFWDCSKSSQHHTSGQCDIYRIIGI